MKWLFRFNLNNTRPSFKGHLALLAVALSPYLLVEGMMNSHTPTRPGIINKGDTND